MNAIAVRILIAGALGFGLLALGGWLYAKHVNEIRAEAFAQGERKARGEWAEADRERLAQEAITTAVATALANERHLAAQKAANEAKDRERDLRVAAAAARTESERLSSQLAKVTSALATAPIEAVRLYAATAGAVFDECQRAYQELAGTADGHASDSLMYQQAWPQ